MDGMFYLTHNVIVVVSFPPYQKYLEPQIFNKAWLSST